LGGGEPGKRGKGSLHFDKISNIFAIFHTTAFYIDATIFSYNPYKYIA
jgi:hypothetical protein